MAESRVEGNHHLFPQLYMPYILILPTKPYCRKEQAFPKWYRACCVHGYDIRNLKGRSASKDASGWLLCHPVWPLLHEALYKWHPGLMGYLKSTPPELSNDAHFLGDTHKDYRENWAILSTETSIEKPYKFHLHVYGHMTMSNLLRLPSQTSTYFLLLSVMEVGRSWLTMLCVHNAVDKVNFQNKKVIVCMLLNQLNAQHLILITAFPWLLDACGDYLGSFTLLAVVILSVTVHN